MTYTPREHPRSREATKQDLIDILALLGWPPVKSLTVPELRAIVRARAAAAGALLERHRASADQRQRDIEARIDKHAKRAEVVISERRDASGKVIETFSRVDDPRYPLASPPWQGWDPCDGAT